MTILIKNIKQLVQVREEKVSFVAGADMKELPVIEQAFLFIKDGIIADFGSMNNCPDIDADEIIDATGGLVLPAWIDSHTHLVYAGNRIDEFVDRINGLSYEEIAQKGGGILNSAKRLQAISEEQLYIESSRRLEEIMAMGTGAVEIKSGYGLSIEGELKMLRVIQKLKNNYPIDIKATFLGAHALPEAYKNNKQAYLDMLVDDLMPIIAKEKLADFVDIFCETGYFSAADTDYILSAAQGYGLRPKIHVNQFTAIGGVAVAVKHKALSVDHLEVMTDADIEALKGTKTMPVALPACSYFLGIPYTPVREIMSAGLPVALATDYNPGSTPSGNMNFVVSTACIKMKMTPEEAINAATINAAYAMDVHKQLGSITKGKKARLILTKALYSYAEIPYAFGSNLIERVF